MLLTHHCFKRFTIFFFYRINTPFFLKRVNDFHIGDCRVKIVCSSKKTGNAIFFMILLVTFMILSDDFLDQAQKYVHPTIINRVDGINKASANACFSLLQINYLLFDLILKA